MSQWDGTYPGPVQGMNNRSVYLHFSGDHVGIEKSEYTDRLFMPWNSVHVSNHIRFTCGWKDPFALY